MRNLLAFFRPKKYFYIHENYNQWVKGKIDPNANNILVFPNGKITKPHPTVIEGNKFIWLYISEEDVKYWRGKYKCVRSYFFKRYLVRVWWD